MLQNVPYESLMWLLGGVFAAAALIEMMASRQLHLNNLLREVVRKKLDWARKKAKAAHMARLAAERKASEEAAFRAQLEMAAEIEEKPAASDPFAPVLFD